MSRLDYECQECGAQTLDHTGAAPTCCDKIMDILWSAPKRTYIGLHPWDRPVIYVDPKTRKHITPMRGDVPMPERYRKWGYERVELSTGREIDAHCKRNNLVHERMNYDSNGKSYDNEG